jgi:hypothetical protein
MRVPTATASASGSAETQLNGSRMASESSNGIFLIQEGLGRYNS